MPRITISEPGKTPQPYRLKTDRKLTRIGRGSDNDIILEAGSASTYHCEMQRVEGGFILKDNNSTNGILLDDTRFKIIDLKDGLTVGIGEDIDFNFELSEEELELLEEEDFEPRQQVAFPKSKVQPEEDFEEPKKLAELDEEEDDDDDGEYEEVVIRRKKKAVSLIDDDDDEIIVKPKKKSRQSKATAEEFDSDRSAAPPAPSHSGGIATTLIFAILAVLFLVGGMVIRHYQDHGTFLFSKETPKAQKSQ